MTNHEIAERLREACEEITRHVPAHARELAQDIRDAVKLACEALEKPAEDERLKNFAGSVAMLVATLVSPHKNEPWAQEIIRLIETGVEL